MKTKPTSSAGIPLFCALCFSLPTFAFSFAATGHQLVAMVCEHELTTKTRSVIRDLLTTESLAEVSTWADEERTRDRSTSTWHYIDYNVRTGKVEAQHAKDPTILDAISSNSVALQSAQSTETRQRALKYLVHFIADLHQPLHCADNDDAGGNKTHILVDGQENRLHRVWDGFIVDRMLARRYQGKSLPEVAALLHNKFASKRASITSGTAEDWAHESFAIARNHVYRLPPPAPGAKLSQLDEEYLTKSESLIEERLAAAGFRLAHVLNSLLDSDSSTTAPSSGRSVLSERRFETGARTKRTPGELSVPAGVH